MKIHWLYFVIATVVCWGAYVPTIHSGQLGFGASKGPIRAFLFVGLAYFMVAVIVPGILLYFKQEPAEFPAKGMGISALAGMFGALGALGIILSMTHGGTPLTVPPLVFAGAPVMSVFVTLALHPPKAWPQWPFYAGIVMAAAGVSLVLKYKPA